MANLSENFVDNNGRTSLGRTGLLFYNITLNRHLLLVAFGALNHHHLVAVVADFSADCRRVKETGVPQVLVFCFQGRNASVSVRRVVRVQRGSSLDCRLGRLRAFKRGPISVRVIFRSALSN